MLSNKDYCDYETCVALKEFGYKVPTSAYYMPNNNKLIFVSNPLRGGYVIDCFRSHNSFPKNVMTSNYIDAPTMWEAQKWLREEKKLVVLVGFDFCPITSEIVYNWVIVVNRNTAKKSSYTYDYFEEALSEGIKEAIKHIEISSLLN